MAGGGIFEAQPGGISMAKLQEIWIEHNANQRPAIRIDWDNDRHYRIEIGGTNPLHLINAFKKASHILENELSEGNLG